MRLLTLDFETRSRVDLRGRGVDNYMRDPSTQVLLASWALDDEDVALWRPCKGEPMPAKLFAALNDPDVLIVAHVAQFERLALWHLLGMKIPHERFRCTMIMAYYMSMPGGLEDVGKILGLDDEHLKFSDGKQLVRKFCVPKKVTKNRPYEFSDWNTDPEDWQRFEDYCVRDTVSERKIYKKMKRFDLPAHEWAMYALDQKINDRGLPVDRSYCENALAMYAAERERVMTELKDITGLDNPNSGAQLLPWLKERGYPYNDLRKAQVNRALKDKAASEWALKVMELRLEVNKVSIKKFSTLLNLASPDGWLRYVFQFMGAARTARWAGRGFQPHNLPRPANKDIEARYKLAQALIAANDYNGLKAEFGNVIAVLSSCIRSAIRAPKNTKIVASDLSAIEDKGTGWVARCDAILNDHRTGRDPYMSMCSIATGKPYEQVTKKERQDWKPARLGCFAAGTPVLTPRGYVAIEELRSDDLVYDGVQWVRHDGVAEQGVLPVVTWAGVQATENHEILTEQGWKRISDLIAEPDLHRSALDLASGLLSGTQQHPASARTGCGASAALSTLDTPEISNAGSAPDAKPARTQTTDLHSAPWLLDSGFREITSIDSPIGSMRSGLAARSGIAPGTTEPAASSAGSPISRVSSDTSRHSTAGTTLDASSTESTMTGTTNPETFDSSRPLPTARTSASISTSPTTARFGLRPNSTDATARRIEISAPSCERSEEDSLRRPSSTSNVTAAARMVYDVVNAGPRTRFTILTQDGPAIAHNCCYRLSGGELAKNKAGDIIKTGLWGYAESMGVEMTQEQAEAAVKAYRAAYAEVVQLWFDLENAAHACVKTKEPQRVGAFLFDIKDPCLRIRLPSGRHLHYIRPKLELKKYKKKNIREGEDPYYEKLVLTYEGLEQKSRSWSRIQTHGGKLTENIVQAWARDVLCEALVHAERQGFHIIGHVHDEIIALVDELDGLDHKDLERAMSIPPSFSPDLPTGAKGYTEIYYWKD